MSLSDIISANYELRDVKGWTAIMSRLGSLLCGYRSHRIAKIMPNNEIQFTIGGTRKGEEIRLNSTIRAIIESTGLEVVERESTSGSRKSGGVYPAISTTWINHHKVLRVLYLVEGAAIQATR